MQVLLSLGRTQHHRLQLLICTLQGSFLVYESFDLLIFLTIYSHQLIHRVATLLVLYLPSYGVLHLQLDPDTVFSFLFLQMLAHSFAQSAIIVVFCLLGGDHGRVKCFDRRRGTTANCIIKCFHLFITLEKSDEAKVFLK